MNKKENIYLITDSANRLKIAAHLYLLWNYYYFAVSVYRAAYLCDDSRSFGYKNFARRTLRGK